MSTPNWYPDEREHAGPEHLDAEYVAGYDAKTQLETTLVDLGCGAGLLAAAAASEAGRVVGVDPSSAMLEVARDRSDAVEWVEAGFLTYEHEGGQPQLVHSPGGVFVLRDLVYDFEPAEADRGIEDWLAHAAPTPAEGWTRGELELHVRDEHSTFAWLLEPMLELAGFEIIARDVRGRIYASYVCLRP